MRYLCLIFGTAAISYLGYSKSPPTTPEGSLISPPAAEISFESPRMAEARALPKPSDAGVPVQNVTMVLRWDQAAGTSRIPVTNDGDLPFTINGVQCTGDFFISKFPESVGPKSSDFIDVIFDAKANSTSDSDVIRLKTTLGDRTIVISHRRESVAQLSQANVTWAIDEANVGKSVQLQIFGGVTKLVKVRPMLGAAVETKEVADGLYQISITPKSTEQPAIFPVFLEFDPAIPGAAPVITCRIGSKS